jgi:hypothetical protein
MWRASSDWVQPLSFKAACKRLAKSIRIASEALPTTLKAARRWGMVLLRHVVTLEYWYDPNRCPSGCSRAHEVCCRTLFGNASE